MSPGNPGPREGGDHPERIGPYRIFDVLGEGGSSDWSVQTRTQPTSG